MVTGGSRGVGEATAILLAIEGATVVITDRKRTPFSRGFRPPAGRFSFSRMSRRKRTGSGRSPVNLGERIRERIQEWKDQGAFSDTRAAFLKDAEGRCHRRVDDRRHHLGGFRRAVAWDRLCRRFVDFARAARRLACSVALGGGRRLGCDGDDPTGRGLLLDYDPVFADAQHGCGIPLPCEFGKIFRARRAATPKPSGVTTSPICGARRRYWLNLTCALSARRAMSNAVVPTARPQAEKLCGEPSASRHLDGFALG